MVFDRVHTAQGDGGWLADVNLADTNYQVAKAYE